MNEEIKNTDVSSENTETTEQVDTSTEETTTENQPEEREYSEMEKKAMQLGWRADQKVENPDDFKTAGEFVRNASLYEKIDEVGNGNKRLRLALKKNNELLSAQMQKTAKQEGDYYQEQKREAIKVGDVDSAEKFEKAFNDSQQVIKAQKENEQFEIDQFRQRNSDWCNIDKFENKVFIDEAASYEDFLVKKYPDMDLSTRLEYTEQHIKNKYFSKPNQNVDKPSAVTISAPENAGMVKRNRKARFEDLSHLDQMTFKEMQLVGGLKMTPDQYAESLTQSNQQKTSNRR